MRFLCALLVLSLFAAVSASANEPAPAAPAASAAAAAPAELSISAPEALSVELTAGEPSGLSQEDLAAALAQLKEMDAARLSPLVSEALAAQRRAEGQLSTALILAPLAGGVGDGADVHCQMERALTLTTDGGNQELLKAIAELQAAGDLTEQGAQRLREVLQQRDHLVYRIVTVPGVAGQAAPQVYSLPKQGNFEWQTEELLKDGNKLIMPYEGGEKLMVLGRTSAEHHAALEERLAQLEARLAELSQKLAELQSSR